MILKHFKFSIRIFLIALPLVFMGLTGYGELSDNPSDKGNYTTDKAFIKDLKYRTFSFFWELADTVSGFTPDRYPTPSFSSIAATGFGLSSYLAGVEEGYITRKEASDRVLKTLRFLYRLPQGKDKTGVAGYKGLFYHFLDMRTGLRYKNVELSTIDTGLLMAGVLSCLHFFDKPDLEEAEIRELAVKLFERVDWEWALNNTDILSMGWHPESGFIPSYWHGYNEAMVLILMAMGSPTHPIPASCWTAWASKYHWAPWQGYEMVNFGPLFGHQYSHIYIDFRGIADEFNRSRGISYFENSRRATLSQQEYCRKNPKNFTDYSAEIWGLTACDGPGYRKVVRNGAEFVFEGYAARGCAADYLIDDGTLAPTAAGGSIPFAPEICLPALENMYKKYDKLLYQEYGFLDAFNPSFTDENGKITGWFDVDYLGIDQGPILLMLTNYQSELIWNLMKKDPYIAAGLKKAGFTGGWIDSW
jgi:hypothetical protein